MTQNPKNPALKNFSKKFYFLLSFWGLINVGLGAASADSSAESSYLDQLKIAERKVLRTQKPRPEGPPTLSASNLDSSSLTSMTPPLYFGRNYQVGDTWRVAALQTPSSIMRMTSNPKHLQFLNGRIGIFRYRVIEVKEGAQPEFTLEIIQEPRREAGQEPRIDSRVESLTLKLNHESVQTVKEYRFRGVNHPIRVAPDALRSAITPWEMYPLDVQEIFTAEKTVAQSFPNLPTSLEKVHSQQLHRVVLKQSSWFEQDDFFGRPIQVLWQKGDPWPAYIKTSNGIAILLSQEAS